MDNTSEARRKKIMRMKRVMLKRTHRRINVTFIIVFVLLLALGVRIFMINYTHGEEYSQAVLNHQTYTSTTIPYMRGNITASDGTVLAYSEKVYNLILDVKSVTSEDGKYLNNTIDALVKCFGLDKDNIKKIINDNPSSQYQKLLKELTSDEIAEFNELKAQKNSNIYGVWFEESYVRKYPFSTLACDVIGFASNVNGGELGLESQYDDELSGTDGVTYSYVDEDLNAVETTKAAVNGNNIVTTIGGYVRTEDMKGLKKYYLQLEDDCQRVNNLYLLNPEIINNDGIYNLLTKKYNEAEEKDIKVNITLLLDFSNLHMKIYEFARILGILLDNAIEASSECEEKIINLTFRNDSKNSRELIIIENTYNDKNLDTEKIFEKGISGKDNHTGLGLWEVRKLIKKNNNINLYTSKNDNFFCQQLEIYY